MDVYKAVKIWLQCLSYWDQNIHRKKTSSNSHSASCLNIEWTGEFPDCAGCRIQYTAQSGYSPRSLFPLGLLGTEKHLITTDDLRVTATHGAVLWLFITIYNYACYFVWDPGLDGRIILRWIFMKWDVGVWTGSSWLRIGAGGGHCECGNETSGSPKMRGISWLAENRLAS